MRLYNRDVYCAGVRVERQVLLQAVSYVCGAAEPT